MPAGDTSIRNGVSAFRVMFRQHAEAIVEFVLYIVVFETYLSVLLPLRAIAGRKRRNDWLQSFGWTDVPEFARWLLHGLFRLPVGCTYLAERYAFSTIHRYEPAVARALVPIRSTTFIDVGANHGQYSILLRNNFRRIIAVEPHPDNVRIMEYAFRLRACSAVIMPYAIAEREGIVILHLARHTGGHSLESRFTYFPNPTEHRNIRLTSSGGFAVCTTTLAALAQRYGLIDLVKVDAEGAELRVLAGAESATRHIIRWVVELHDLTRKAELEEWMAKHEYAFRWLDFNHIFAVRR